MKRSATIILAAAAVLVTTVLAQASTTVQIKNRGLLSDTRTGVKINGQNSAVGIFELEIDGHPDSVYSYCTDIGQTIANRTYTFTVLDDLTQMDVSPNNCQIQALYGLFAELDSSWTIVGYQSDEAQDQLAVFSMDKQTKTEAAAVQLMLWEITHDFDGTDTDQLDLDTGSYVFTGNAVSTAVRDRFNALKNLLIDGGHTCTPGSEVTSVPSPAAAFVGFGLMGSMLMRRRRKES